MTRDKWWDESAQEFQHSSPASPSTAPPSPPSEGTWWTPDEGEQTSDGQGATVPTAQIPTAQIPTAQIPTAQIPTAQIPMAQIPTVDPSQANTTTFAAPVAPPPAPPAPDVLTPAPSGKQERRHRRRIRQRLGDINRVRAVAVLAVLASFAGLTYSVRHALSDQKVFDPTALLLSSSPDEVDPDTVGAGSLVDMPDVRNSTLEHATSIIAEAGIPEPKITVQAVDHAGKPGIVVKQEPSPGTDNPESATIYVSRSIAMPDYVNRDEKAVVTQLKQLGATAKIEHQFRSGATLGAVLSQSVAVGAPMPEYIELVVAGDGAQVPVEMVATTENDCSQQSEPVVHAVTYSASTVCSVSYSSSSAEPYRTIFVLSGEFNELSVTLGIADNSDPGFKARLRVLADGNVAADRTFGIGQSETVKVPVTGAIQMTFEATFVGSPPSGSYPDVLAVFGSPTLLTSPSVAAKYQAGK